MFDLNTWLAGLVPIAALGAATWVVSVIKRDASIVDSMWSLLFLAAALVYAAVSPVEGPRPALVLVLLGAWALRLAGYITWRNWGQPEDRRYQEIRARNEPNFAVKSLYLVFGLQGVLAWVVSLPLLAALTSARPINTLDVVAAVIILLGLAGETIADWQLARFSADPTNRDRVLDTGLWRYTRHPNYFFEFCVWWGFYLLALAAGGWWAIVSPLLMSVLLLRVSGVMLLEKDIASRRPDYRRYVERTNAFFPGPPRRRLATAPKECTR